ncbi:hypothetical protein SAMN04487949_3603 [Halogranum gelatinilyticum]|uniref:Profilin fold domain-containing protein n=1 Tax=Halogranum gelatinilyticum TaxID=660521 RepID=A0A1G9ZC91_9EURY|nr:hypothetical protein [Halogranum gelatinilyticum]SDN18998.1 hypothetical protein SAMN04487949_3603 [Halogranum gelatinilyticum]
MAPDSAPDFDADITSTDSVAEHREELLAAVNEHAGRIARELALLQGGDYGSTTFNTDRGEWTVKYEAGALQYLRFSGKAGGDIYVVSTQRPPEPKDLVTAMKDYDAFVESYNEHVASLDGVLDDVTTDFPDVVSTETVVVERDRIVGAIRETANDIAGQLHRFEGDSYGTFARRVGGKRWELKWEDGVASYLRVGGEGGIYLVSQYSPPSARDVRTLADGFVGFVEAYNEFVDELESDLSQVTFGDN